MADDIVIRLRDWVLCDTPTEMVMLEAADEIERLRRALLLACGLLSTYEDNSMFHPEKLVVQFIEQAVRGG